MTYFLKLSIIGMIIGYLLDVLFGDPNVVWHPIRLIGRLISFLEKHLYNSSDLTDCENQDKSGAANENQNNDECKIAEKMSRTRRRRGRILAALVIVAVLAAVELIRIAAFLLHPFVFVAVEAVLVWLGLAQTSLRRESMKVYYAFLQNDTEKARYAVSMIVGRDTEKLTDKGIMRAAVETVAENTSDGITAPLVYCALFGAAGEYVYKAVNTMDSMVGYKNEKYMDFGRCAAKLDDVLNFIPSRLSAVLMIVSSFILGMDYKNAAKIFRRDRRKHASPNSAQTESVCAGALDLRLAGDAWYGGILFKKDYIGDDIKPIENNDIKRACRLMSCTGVLSFALAAAVRCVILLCMAA